MNLPNGTDEDPFVDLYGATKAAASVPYDGTHDRKTRTMPAQAQTALPAAVKAEAWWRDPTSWLKVLTPLVVVVWGFYLVFYFAKPDSVPDTFVPPGIRQEAEAKPSKPAVDPVDQQKYVPPVVKTSEAPAPDVTTSETDTPSADSPSASPSASTPVSSPTGSFTPEESATPPQTSQSATPAEPSAETTSEAPVLPPSDTPSTEPSTDGVEEQPPVDAPSVTSE